MGLEQDGAVSILSMTLSGPRLRAVQNRGEKWALVYGLGMPLQISPTQTALILNRRVCGTGVDDLEDGCDAVIFDELNAIRPENAIPLTRNGEAVHPKTGRKLILVKYPLTGGFVPLGAKLADGSPHPHAGTGFGLCTILGYPSDHSVHWPAGEADTPCYHELVEFRCDGNRFVITGSEMYEDNELMPGLEVSGLGLRNAIADGEDLIMGLVAGRRGEVHFPGLSRWRHSSRGWRLVEYVPASGPHPASEPSLLRDTDGSLLMAVRGTPLWRLREKKRDGLEEALDHFRVYRSTDNGRTWRLHMDLPRMRIPSPVVLNRTVGGRPFLAANPHRQEGGAAREAVWLWPLTPDRRGVEAPLRAMDGNVMLGPVRRVEGCKANFWCIDHPVGEVCRLKDGRWHSLLCIRVLDIAQSCTPAMPTPQTGCWVEEVTCEGEGNPLPTWRF